MSTLADDVEAEQARQIIERAQYFLEYRTDCAAWERKYGTKIPGVFGSITIPPAPPFPPSREEIEWAERVLSKACAEHAK